MPYKSIKIEASKYFGFLSADPNFVLDRFNLPSLSELPLALGVVERHDLDDNINSVLYKEWIGHSYIFILISGNTDYVKRMIIATPYGNYEHFIMFILDSKKSGLSLHKYAMHDDYSGGWPHVIPNKCIYEFAEGFIKYREDGVDWQSFKDSDKLTLVFDKEVINRYSEHAKPIRIKWLARSMTRFKTDKSVDLPPLIDEAELMSLPVGYLDAKKKPCTGLRNVKCDARIALNPGFHLHDSNHRYKTDYGIEVIVPKRRIPVYSYASKNNIRIVLEQPVQRKLLTPLDLRPYVDKYAIITPRYAGIDVLYVMGLDRHNRVVVIFRTLLAKEYIAVAFTAINKLNRDEIIALIDPRNHKDKLFRINDLFE